MTRGALPPYRRRLLDPADGPTRIGAGAIGGKAAGLVDLRDEVIARLDPGSLGGVMVDVPRLTVLTTDVFDAMVAMPELVGRPWDDLPDRRIAALFQQTSLPAAFLGDLRSLTEWTHQPLAVRSSSLLEDALAHPFAGVYATKMIPNRRLPDRRFAQLVRAVKFVLASTFFAGARAYRRAAGLGDRREAMAVVVQEVIGRRHGERFYPDISGVARTWNPTPWGGRGPRTAW